MVKEAPIASFIAYIEHGCLILQDVASDGDISDWDPNEANWHQDESSIIFSVMPSVVNPVSCEVWRSTPPTILPLTLFETELPCPHGMLVVHDPNEHVKVAFYEENKVTHCSVRVDDAQNASYVQIIITRKT
ncbi:hypothetical protein [Actinoalloteichus caeruleus]|uniref:hypothetical protein n=1 Tax=Actinoalloteichus cyanogriseus TaxID=2893586 RepID=UPI0012DD2E32|nr:hypothetical protein [Actinoalloteichus caeruleus]